MQLPVISLLIIVAIVIGNPAHAKPSMQVKAAVERVENLNPRGQNLVLPYGFNAESTGPVLGLGGMRKGFLQDQMTVGGAAFAGEAVTDLDLASGGACEACLLSSSLPLSSGDAARHTHSSVTRGAER